jgi:uncharacterized membrane protein
MTTNPYAAPKAAVADETVVLSADLVPGGQSRPAGNGWTWITDAWEIFKRQPGLWIGVILLLFVIFAGASLLPIIGGFLTTLFGPVFAAGIVTGCKKIDGGGEMELGDMFAGFRERTGTLIGVGALYLAAVFIVMLVVGLIMGVGMFTLMGGNPEQMAALGVTVLLAVLIMTALLLPAVMAVWFAAPLVVFHGHGAVDAMKGSFSGCLKNILPFLLYSVILMVFLFVAAIPLLLGWLVLWPVIAASVYTSYKDIYLKPRSS